MMTSKDLFLMSNDSCLARSELKTWGGTIHLEPGIQVIIPKVYGPLL